MAEYFKSGAQTVESEFESYQVKSEDKSGDEECFDNLPSFENSGADSTCVKNSETAVSGNSTGVVPTDFQTDKEVLEVEKSHSAFDSKTSAQDVHHSSGESHSSGSSTNQGFVFEELPGDPDMLNIRMFDHITDNDVPEMLRKFGEKDYSAQNSDGDFMIAKCRMLYERDYYYEEVDNSGGVLCASYPARLIVPVAVKSTDGSTERSDGVTFDPKSYAEEIKNANACRLRKRFVTPVMMFDKKFICRSATITVRKTATFETALQSPEPQAQKVDDGYLGSGARWIETAMEISNAGLQAAGVLCGGVEKLRYMDAQIIRDLKVQHICDLMIENRKTFLTLNVCSSEKINEDIYHDFNIQEMPYPGCEFFKQYHGANRNPEGLIFSWDTSGADVSLQLTEDPSENFPDIALDKYKDWDLVEMTKNYMKILLLYLAKDTGGLLVHCISGWDRTPLFISLLRVSLWADGIIHQKLNYKDMAYLTLTYDWYLFGHNLRNRLDKKEKIMHFCFKFLPYIVDDEFSLTRIFHELRTQQRENRSLPDFQPGVRAVAINELSTYVLNIYDKILEE